MRKRLVQSRLIWLYGILVLLLVTIGAWWFYFVTHEGQVRADFHRAQLASEREHALLLIRSDPALAADPEGQLGHAFPELVFSRRDGDLTVDVRPEILQAIEDQVRATRNMFLSEGLFFLALLLAGVTILIHAWRSEIRYKQARELFLAGATHEFKTPLASLRLYTETLGRRELTDDDRQRIHGRMLDDLLRLEALVDDVLALSSDGAFGRGPRQTLDLARECRTVVTELQSFANDRGARIRLSAPPGCFILGQRLIFALALRNLIGNAVKHGGRGVKVDVIVEAGPEWHRVHVRDDGPGIPRRLHARIFSCFYSACTDRDEPDEAAGERRTGAGVGLYLVKRNVEKLGGRVELESTLDKGATFTLYLPAIRPPDSPDAVPATDDDGTGGDER